MVLASFWLLLILALLLPTPFRVVLREGGSRAKGRNLASGVGTPVKSPSPASPSLEHDKGSGIPAVHDQEIEDPAESLAALAHALKHPHTLVRILHIGDSQIDLDHISADMRQRMQSRHGAGGHGLLPVIRPWRWFRQRGISYTAQKGLWDRFRLGGGKRPDNRLGLGLLAAQSEGYAWSRIALSAGNVANQASLSYLAGPKRGSIELRVDKSHIKRIETQVSEHRAPKHERPHETRLLTMPIPTNARVLRIITRGHVRLFGLALERVGQKGVTWENLPAISGRFHQLAQLDGTLFEQQLKLRPPSMVVFQFGANDAISYGDSIASYKRNVGITLSRITKLPNVACLVIGPLDQLERRGGKLQSRRSVERVLNAQRSAARDTGCAFWDAHAAMGGAGSIQHWRARRLTRADFIHLNKRGAAELARLLDTALVASLQRFR
ncbi:MAG: hypothetical protein JRH20_14665 [Deltaproteobacteria bacterium]|nr:hypothetical protein [Deltaproteobacteria bacterium]